MKSLRLMVASLAVLLFAGLGAFAQVPSVPGPYNVPLGAVITNTGQGAATVNTAQENNLSYHGAICTYNQTAKSGTPSTTIAIQMYDSASATYQSLVTSGAITANATPTSIVVYPGIQTSTLPTGMVALNLQLPRYWRVQEVVGGTGTPTVTGTVGCDLLK